MKCDQHADAAWPSAELYEQAAAARRRSMVLHARLQDARHTTGETLQLIQAAWDRAEQARALCAASRRGRLRVSAYARMQARLDSMPVIEQAKGIIMAQSGWSEGHAFDARRASQRENVRVRDLAARLVANTLRSAADQQPAPSVRADVGRKVAG